VVSVRRRDLRIDVQVDEYFREALGRQIAQVRTDLLQGTDLRPIRLPVRTLPAPGRRSAARQGRRIPRLRSGLIIAGTLA
jgi:hypothetical protein